MTVGEKIKKFRLMRNMTQKELAMRAGLSEPAIRNYELGNRNPSQKHRENIAGSLGVSEFAISDPDLESYVSTMHALFYMEDKYGFAVEELDGKICLTLDKESSGYQGFTPYLETWHERRQDMQDGATSREDYDEWRYSFPEGQYKKEPGHMPTAFFGKSGKGKKGE